MHSRPRGRFSTGFLLIVLCASIARGQAGGAPPQPEGSHGSRFGSLDMQAELKSVEGRPDAAKARAELLASIAAAARARDADLVIDRLVVDFYGYVPLPTKPKAVPHSRETTLLLAVVVDYEAALARCADGRRAKKKLQAEFDLMQKELDDKRAELSRKYKALAAKRAAGKSIDDEKMLLDQRSAALRARYESLQQTMDEHRAAETALVVAKLRNAARQVANRSGFRVIIDAHAVVANVRAVDMTNAVVDELDMVPAQPGARAEVLVGAVLDRETVLNQSRAGRAVKELLQPNSNRMNSIINAGRKQLESAEAALAKRDGGTPAEQADLARLREQIKQREDAARKEFEEEQAKRMGPLQERISRATSEVARARGVDLVLDRAWVVYAREGLDLSAAVAARLDGR